MFALLVIINLGIDIQQVSVAAVIISLGLLVDNGLVVVEDIQTKVNNGMTSDDAAIASCRQLFVPLAVASLTTIAAFIPMLILDGKEGQVAFSHGSDRCGNADGVLAGCELHPAVLGCPPCETEQTVSGERKLDRARLWRRHPCSVAVGNSEHRGLTRPAHRVSDGVLAIESGDFSAQRTVRFPHLPRSAQRYRHRRNTGRGSKNRHLAARCRSQPRGARYNALCSTVDHDFTLASIRQKRTQPACLSL